MKKTYHIEGLSCGGCASALTKMLTKDENIEAVEVNLEQKEACITSTNPIDLDACNALLDVRGFVLSNL